MRPGFNIQLSLDFVRIQRKINFDPFKDFEIKTFFKKDFYFYLFIFFIIKRGEAATPIS